MLIIQAGKYGRLGNRLILSAHLLAFAREYGYYFIDFGFDEYSDFFSSSNNRPILSWPKFPIGVPFTNTIRTSSFKLSRHITVGGRAQKIFGAFNWFEQIYLDSLMDEVSLDLEENQELVERLTNSKIIVCDGWWIRSNNLVKKHSKFLIDFFQPVTAIQMRAKRRVEQLRDRVDYLIGVHVRREDYRDVAPHLVFDDQHWREILQHLKRLFYPQRIHFIVCSNEVLEWENIEGISYTFAKESAVIDMHILALCDYIVGPPSTFSEWAAFIGGAKLCVLRSKNIELDIGKFSFVDFPVGTRI